MKLLTVLLMTCGLTFAQYDAAGRSEAQRKVLNELNLQHQAEVLRQVAQIEAIRAELTKLRVVYTDEYPSVRRAEAQLRELEAALELSLKGKGYPPELWWRDARYRSLLGVSADQQTKIDDVFQQYKLKLVALNAALQKEEIMLEPLIAANPLNETKAATQIDRVAQARAELEKARGRMLLGMRKVLTGDQWKKLGDFSK